MASNIRTSVAERARWLAQSNEAKYVTIDSERVRAFLTELAMLEREKDQFFQKNNEQATEIMRLRKDIDLLEATNKRRVK